MKLADDVTKISQDMIIADIISRHPETLSIFKQYNLDCYECQIADLETLGHGAGVHKVDIDRLLTSLNNSLIK
jgi:hybrid cluster-associated redox disulfide protein